MAKNISIIGLGAGDMNQLSLGLYRKIKAASHLYLRTKEHPVVNDLVKEGIIFQSFDEIYEKHEQFEDVYEEIVNELCAQANDKDIVYAVPGHPLVAEKTVQLLLTKKGEYSVVVEGGQSFIDPLFAALEIDPIDGFQFVDALSFDNSQLQLNQHIIICQVYDQMIASNVKLSLMEQLPDDYDVYIVTAAGSEQQLIKKVPLYELDRGMELTNLTSVYVPPVREERLLYHQFSTLRTVIAALRGPGGCPWDQKQTHKSLKKYLLEEAYELIEAIDNEDDDHMAEELGDVLLQIMLHSQIAEEEGMFTVSDVIQGITEKMIRRHPHVFGDVTADSVDDVISNWNEIKKKEKSNTEEGSLLDGVSKSLPGLSKAYKYQAKAATVGFDWKDVKPMWEKVDEELKEFKDELNSEVLSQEKILSEFGDILFAFVNIGRYYNIDPEEAITATNHKFYRRFTYIEKEVRNQGKQMESLSLEELDSIWEESKKQGL
ncbi:nucleoside triphosphate pyrophosphohydrolase [Cytobacillus suaedae]|nr:nucleoside triphosphate pyrophosphohydrolase [Cytobacillus suaedae]